MAVLERGLKTDFVEALEAAYGSSDWWTKIVNDEELFVVPRKKSVRVYYRGNRLLNLRFHDGQLIGSVHYKYLLNPKLKRTYWNVRDGRVEQPPTADAFITNLFDLDLLKQASSPYAGPEKHGVSQIIATNPNVIDVEVAFSDSNDSADDADELIGGAKAPHNPRLDFVAVQGTDTERRAATSRPPSLVFFEAKHFSNHELRSSTSEPHVVQQIGKYADLLRTNKEQIADAYRHHCEDMLKAKFVPTNSPRRQFLEAVKDAANLEVNPDPRLIVFGFDADQEPGPTWKPHKEKLEMLLRERVFLRGNAKGFVRGVEP